MLDLRSLRAFAAVAVARFLLGGGLEPLEAVRRALIPEMFKFIEVYIGVASSGEFSLL